MKKVLSLFLSVILALSVFSGISIQAYAAEVESVECILSRPLSFFEGDVIADTEGNLIYNIFTVLNSKGNEILVEYSDGTTDKYVFSYYDYEVEIDGDIYTVQARGFINEDGDELDYYIRENQAATAWGVGEHYFQIVVDGICSEPIPVTVNEMPYTDVDFVPVVPKVCDENTNGFWAVDNKDEDFYCYIFSWIDEGDKLVFTKTDGSKEVYTYAVDEEAFFDNNGDKIHCSLGDNIDVNQWEEHWYAGEDNYYTITIIGFEIKIPVTILTALACNHEAEWQSDNEIIVKKCTICDEELSRLPFEDLGNCAYYGDYVEYTSVSNKFITGTNPPARTLFSPTTPITRAMFVTILYRMAGEPYANNNPYSSSPFSDIKDTSVYYYDAACWALKNGITTETTFKPFDNVSREQTASFLFRYAKDNDTVGDDEYKNVNLKSYPDYSSVHSWAEEALQWANYNGMITGTQQGYINPQGATQRIHATKILYGFGKVCNIGNFA